MRDYWESNIAGFGEFYSDISGEELLTSGLFRAIYRRSVMRIEQRLMRRRYDATLHFIDEHVGPGLTALDVGCGTGVFVVAMLRRGAHVVALDYARTALDLTRQLVQGTVPHRASDVEYVHADITEVTPPRSDVAIAVGVTPYVDDIAAMYGQILPTTSVFYCLVVDRDHWANRLRRAIPALNVRHLRFFARAEIDTLLDAHGFRSIQRTRLGSGYLDLAVRRTRR